MKTTPCKGCGKPMTWAVTDGGKRIPLDPKAAVYLFTEPEGGTGNPKATKAERGLKGLMTGRIVPHEFHIEDDMQMFGRSGETLAKRARCSCGWHMVYFTNDGLSDTEHVEIAETQHRRERDESQSGS